MTVAERHVFEDSLELQGADGRYELVVPAVWEGQPSLVYGGFILSLILRAAGLETTTGRPASLACQFLRPLLVGQPVDIEVVPVRRGRSSDLLRVCLRQAGKLAVEAQVRTTAAATGPLNAAEPSTDLGNPLDFRLNSEVEREAGWEHIPLFESYVEIRTDWSSDAADAYAWVRLGSDVTYDDPFMEAARLALFLDQQAPAVLNNHGYLIGANRTQLPWGFTNLDLLVHFHKPRGSDWLCYLSHVIDAVDGLASAQTQVWSESGALLATAISQIAFFAMDGKQLYG